MDELTLFDDPDETTFEFYGSAIRYRRETSGVWVDATDVARLLGYAKAPDMVRSLPEGGYAKLRTPFGDKNYLSEQGFYRAVMKSSHAAADEMIGKAAELFVQLRTTGVVTVADAVPQAELSRLEILTMALDAEKAKLAAEAKVAELEPAAEAYHGWLDNDGLVSVSDAWRMIKTVHRIHRDEFFALLRAWRVITVSGVTLQAWFVDKGYGTNIAVAYSENGQRLQGKVNPAGIDYLLKRLRKLS